MSSLPKRPKRPHITEGHRAMTAVITLSLAAVGTAIYLSPTSAQSAAGAATAVQSTQQPTPTSVPDGSVTVTDHPTPTPSHSHSTAPRPVIQKYYITKRVSNYVPVYHPVPATTATAVRYVKIKVKVNGKTVTKIVTIKVPATPKHLYCTDFKWQQDAQAAYLENLSDPWGLDGAPGPNNGDGLACTQLPVDPSRRPSTPSAPYIPPAPADKAALVSPNSRYFGLAEDGLPGDSAMLSNLARQVGKAPSALQWFTTWDSGYDSGKARDAWAHGALPVITWMTVSSDPSGPTAGSYTLSNIVNGSLDNYLLAYAGAVIRTGVPVAIRFDHEMNGNWFPWSGGLRQNAGATPGAANLYVQAWRHIWNVFNSVGANDYVIWLWSPVRVDNIKPHSTTSGFKYETTLSEDYPGDSYVDWVGMTAYEYKPTDPWTYEATFRATLSQLGALTNKPIFISETAASQSVGNTDYSQQKAAWTQQTLAGLAAEPNVVGFSWFNNTVNDVHTVDGVPIQTDWQFYSSAPALAAFKAGIADPRFSSGLMPDASTG